LKWQNIDADDLPTDVKQSFDAMIETEAAFKAELEKLLKKGGHMPEDKFPLLSRKGNVLVSRIRAHHQVEAEQVPFGSKPKARDATPQKGRLSAGLVLGLTP
jgi:hypothetical protein